MKRQTTLLLIAIAVPVPATAQNAIDTLLQVEAGARLEVDAFVGDVRVGTWDQNRVRVRAPHRQGVQIDSNGSVVRVESEPPRGGRRERWFEITVPAQMDVSIEALNGDITVHGAQGRVEAESVNGDVEVTGGRTLVDLGSVKGTVHLSGARGKVQAMSVNASVSIDDVVGDIEAETVNGPIVITGVDTGQLEASSVNGGIRYAGTLHADGWYRLETHNGAIEMMVPSGSGATVTARTYNGDLLTGFPAEVREMAPGKQVTFTIGSGGARIELETFNGAIEINAGS